MLGCGVLAWGIIGTYATNIAEDKFNLKATEEDKRKLREALPTIRVVDRGSTITENRTGK